MQQTEERVMMLYKERDGLHLEEVTEHHFLHHALIKFCSGDLFCNVIKKSL